MIEKLSLKVFIAILIILIIVSTTGCGAVTPVPTPTNIPTKTPTPTSTNTPVPTLTNTPTLVAFPVYGYDVLLSPDGTKKAVYDAHTSNTFKVIDKNEKILWSITYDVHKFDDYGLYEAWYKPFYWSKDERSLYYTCFHGQEIDGSGKFWGNEFIDGCGVFRLDLVLQRKVTSESTQFSQSGPAVRAIKLQRLTSAKVGANQRNSSRF